MAQPLRTYKIITPRILIRCYEAGDGAKVKRAIDESLPELLPYMVWAKHEPETIEAKEKRIMAFREKFLSAEDYTLGVFNHHETEIIASTGLHTRHEGNVLEIGYWVNTKYAGNGICTEIVKALNKVAFEIEGLDKLIICCEEGNRGSRRVAEKCGYIFAEKRETKLPGEDKPRTMLWYQLKKEAYNPCIHGISIQAFDMQGRSLL